MDAGRRSARGKKKSLYDVIEAAATFYEAPMALPHRRLSLGTRRFDGATASQFRLGYATQGNALIEH